MTDLYVSEHAVSRYRERVGSALEAAEIRKALARLLRPAAVLGATRYTLAGVTFCLKRSGESCTVTTIYTDQNHCPRRVAPRSDLSRKERHRRMRKGGKKAGR